MFCLISALACILINSLLGYCYHISETDQGEPCQLPRIIWILYGIASLIPICNIVLTVVLIIYLFTCYLDEDFHISEKYWLGKKY